MKLALIEHLRRAIKAHPDFETVWKAKIFGGYTIDNCSTKQLAWLARNMGIDFVDDDRRGRPRKQWPNTHYNEPTPYNPPIALPDNTKEVAPMETAQLGTIDAMIAAIVKQTIASMPATLDEGKVLSLIAEHAQKPIEKPIHVTLQGNTNLTPIAIPDGTYHYALPLILSAVDKGVNVLLVGPAGSGKTTIAEQIATILGLSFYFTGAINSEYKLSGFIDAQGRIISTSFREAYENGGLFLFDEMDGSHASAILAFNAALANGHADFPNPHGGSTPIKRHPNFRAIAAANTYGRGQNRIYVGRNQLDGASLDRFITIDFNYDTYLEAKIAGVDIHNDNPSFVIAPRELTTTSRKLILDVVHKARHAFESLKLEMICSPRASINFIKLYEAGWPVEQIAPSVIFKGMVPETKEKVLAYDDHALAHALVRLA